jgi:hypothetical protein
MVGPHNGLLTTSPKDVAEPICSKAMLTRGHGPMKRRLHDAPYFILSMLCLTIFNQTAFADNDGPSVEDTISAMNDIWMQCLPYKVEDDLTTRPLGVRKTGGDKSTTIAILNRYGDDGYDFVAVEVDMSDVEKEPKVEVRRATKGNRQGALYYKITFNCMTSACIGIPIPKADSRRQFGIELCYGAQSNPSKDLNRFLMAFYHLWDITPRRPKPAF